MGNVWRINMKTDGIKNVTQKQLTEFCKTEELIAIGWSDPWFIEGIEHSILSSAKDVKNYIWNRINENPGSKTRSFSTASNVIVDRMAIGDYVWTRAEGKYLLAKIIGEPLFSGNIDKFKQYDIGFCRKVKYLDKELTVSEVPGKIIASFSARSSTQNIYDENMSLYNYSNALFNGEKVHSISTDDWAKFFSADDVEEIIGLYLQIKKNLYVYTSTNKNSTDKIEFELVDRSGTLYGVQVKTGEVSIDANDYLDISKTRIVYLFATSNKVNTHNSENIIHLTLDDVTQFIMEYKHLLPERIKAWLG